MPPVAPMLAKLVRELPPAEGVLFEPKWDGFRCVVFRDGDEVELGSRNERPLTRYFPELLDPLRAQLPGRCVVDGEVVIATGRGLDFDALLQRIHPAESRVRLLARQTPASFVAFDLLALDEEDLRSRPQGERRRRLEEVLAGARPPVHLTPATTDREVAAEWFTAFEGAGLEGVVAKPLHLPYREGERCMLKVKHERTADCVVGGFRWHKSGGVVGSLLLGLYDDAGVLHHVGVTAAFPMAERRALVDRLTPYREGALPDHPWAAWADAVAQARTPKPSRAEESVGRGSARAEVRAGGGTRMPGGQSRWSAGRDLAWEPLRPELIVEVRYDHLQGDRFRHAAQFVRFRDDRSPASCTYTQLEEVAPAELARIFGTG